MKCRAVVWSADAIDDLIATAEYIAEENPAAARKVAKIIRQSGSKLGEFSTGRRGRVEQTYEKIVAKIPYIIAYRIDARPNAKEVVQILHIIHTARDWDEENWPED